jgi:hypothetical protein
VAFLVDLRPVAPPSAGHAVDVDLVRVLRRPSETPAAPRETAPGPKSPGRTGNPPDIPVAAQGPGSITPPPALIRPETVARAGPNGSLHGVLGCAHAEFLRLSDIERRACEDRFLTPRSPVTAAASFGLDPGKRAAFDAAGVREPLLAQTPVNGCRPRVAEKDDTVLGQSRPDWRATVGCAFSF